VRTMSRIDRTKAHGRWGVMSLAFSRDSRAFASGGSDKVIKLTIGGATKLLRGHAEFVQSVAFSPDGQILASGSDDHRIILWDVLTGESIGSLTGHSADVYSVTFAPDGKTLASGARDSTVYLWNVDLDSWKARACEIANRNLTKEEWRKYLGDDEPYRHTCPNTKSWEQHRAANP
jgi:WD40 repeat protein